MKKLECTILIKDEVKCAVLGLQENHTDILKKQFSRLVPTRFYQAAFKLGTWDGKIAFFHEAGDTFVFLLDEIVPILEDYGYKIKLVDKRKSVVYTPESIDNTYFSHVTMFGGPLILRDHQVKVVNDLIAAGSGIGKAATSAGKTFICGAITKIYEEMDDIRTIIIVPNKTLVRQTHKEFVKLGIDVGIYYGDKKDTDHKHLISTWQSLINKPHMMRDYQCFIIDETHGAKGKSIQDLLIKHGSHIAYRFGVTGTMPKDPLDQMTIKTAIGHVVTEIGAAELIDKKILAKLDITIYELEHNLRTEFAAYTKSFRKTLTRETPLTYTEFKDGYLPDYTAEKSYNSQYQDHILWIVDKLEEIRNEHGNVLVLVDGVKHGQRLSDLIEGSYFLSGSDKAEAREEIYEQYKTRDDMLTIATAQIASTGLSINRIYALCYINFGKSGIKVIQSVGRGLRTAEDKDFVAVYDFTNDFKFSRRHTSERIKFYKEEKYPHAKKKIKFAATDSDLFD